MAVSKDTTLPSGYILRLTTNQRSQSQSGNYSTVDWSIQIIKNTGSGKWASGTCYWSATIGGQYREGSIGGYDFRNYTTLTVASGSVNITHNSDGTKSITSSCGWDDNNTYGELGDGAVSGLSMTLTRIPKVPGDVGTPSMGTITPTEASFSWSAPSDNGGSAITQYQWVVELPNGSDVTSGYTNASTRSAKATGLTPGTAYTVRVRAYNAVGSQTWDQSPNKRSFTTAAAGAPTKPVVTPATTGLSAGLRSSTPAGVVATSFIWERRITGTTAVVQAGTSPSGTFNATGLSAGTSYDWRASYMVGSYRSPASAWTTAVQPSPDTNPGQYWDGSTPSSGGTAFSWTGTAGKSTSQAKAKGVTGWGIDAALAGSTGVLSVQTGGRTRSKAARVTVLTDATGDRFKMGQRVSPSFASDVAENGVYTGSIYVQLPYRSQLMAAVIDWGDGTSSTPIATSDPGTAVLVPVGNTTWTRLTVQATAPAGALKGSVRALDTNDGSSSWSPWITGDIIVLDDVMLTLGDLVDYFDGATPDSASYDYSWTGTADQSTSQRLVLTDSAFDPFADPDCPIPAPPVPPTIDDPCIVEVGTWRRYWAVIDPAYILDWLEDVVTIRISNGSVASRQIRIRIYENPDNLDPTVFTGDWVSEQIVSYMPPNSEYVIDGVDETMDGTVDWQNWQNVSHLLYGSGGGPATWPVLRCGIGYLISFDTPLDAPLANAVPSVALTRRFGG